MAKDLPELDKLKKLIEETPLSNAKEGIEVLPIAHNEFQARWSLSADAIEKGRKIASHEENGAHLVLRAFSLPTASHSDAVSDKWHDFHIEGTENNGYFTLPGSADAVNASIGLVNKDGRFSPLVRGESVCLPAARPTVAPTQIQAEPASDEKADIRTEALAEPDTAESADQLPEPTADLNERCRPASYQVLNEEAICARLATIEGLPDFFKAPASHALEDLSEAAQFVTDGPDLPPVWEIAHKLECTGTLDERAIHDAVRAKLAVDPQPEIAPSEERSSGQTTEALEAFHAGASEQLASLASQWEELWSDQAPVEIRACFILSGKIAPGLRLLLGAEPIKPTAGGFFTWKHEINTFGQTWPLLQAALDTPSVPAGPALEFFKDVERAQRMLEFHGSLEIEGKVTDPDYYERLPRALSVDAAGHFKLTRMLPNGAIVLPSLSLVAD
jgi:hypothetical protein